MNGSSATRLPARRALSPSARRAALTAHIIVSVGLLGDSAGFLAVALRGVSTGDPELADASWTLLEMFSLVFGIPLSFAALITGVALGMGTSWGVLRYPWTTVKLLLVISVMLVGTLVLPPADELRSGQATPTRGSSPARHTTWSRSPSRRDWRSTSPVAGRGYEGSLSVAEPPSVRQAPTLMVRREGDSRGSATVEQPTDQRR